MVTCGAIRKMKVSCRHWNVTLFGLALVGMARAVLIRSLEGEDGGDDPSDAILDLFLEGAAR